MYYIDRRKVAGAREMAVALAYEEQARKAVIVDTSRGDMTAKTAIRQVLEKCEKTAPPVISADLLSSTAAGRRIIEVKARGSFGPVTLNERELNTLEAAADCGWLYVVWHTTQPSPYELWLVQDPARLPRVESRAATRSPGQARGNQHEAQYEIQAEDVESMGVRVDLTVIDGLPVKD
jgi:hypothetical protein